MKKISKILIPMAGTASVVASMLPSVSCSTGLKTLASLEWDTNSGDFEYDSSIPQKEIKNPDGSDKIVEDKTMTRIYFGDVTRNYNIFVNDLMYTMLYQRAYAATWGFDKYILPVQYDKDFIPQHAKAALYQWDVESNRISFDFEIDFVGEGRDGAEAHYSISVRNMPYAFHWTDNWGGQPDSNFQFLPLGLCRLDWEEFERIEEVDPLFPGSEQHKFVMTLYKDWSIDVKEKYILPLGNVQSYDFYQDYDEWLRADANIYEDPEVFAEMKYFLLANYFNAPYYLQKVIGE